MKLYLTKTPNIIQHLFPEFVWRFSSIKKEIYLTFDDGPTPKITQFVLDNLKNYNAKATFFCIGKNIENYPEVYHQIIAEGHSIANHTQNHLNGFKTKTADYLANVLACETVISSLSSSLKINTAKKSQPTKNLKLFRPPYGKIKKKQAIEIQKLGYKIILWDVLSADFDTSIKKEKCLKNVLKNTRNGSIIVFHDSVKATEKLNYVLPKVLEYYSKKGFEFKPIS